jgi:hypothetical protein
MLERTKKHHTEKLVPLHLLVKAANVCKIKDYVEALESPYGTTPWREVAGKRGSVPASVLRGSRGKEELTQMALSELTGIPQRHISEMEQGKRPIGKESAKKLSKALKTDYRVFL